MPHRKGRYESVQICRKTTERNARQFDGDVQEVQYCTEGPPIQQAQRKRLRAKTIPPGRCNGPLCCAKSSAGEERRLKQTAGGGMCKAWFRKVSGAASSGSTQRPRGSESSGGPDATQLIVHGNQHWRKRAISLCPDRAQSSGVDGHHYCTKHNSCSHTRNGFKCASMRIDDYNGSHTPVYSCNTHADGSFDGKCPDCQALHSQSECVNVGAGREGNTYTMCCAHGRAPRMPRPTTVPPKLWT